MYIDWYGTVFVFRSLRFLSAATRHAVAYGNPRRFRSGSTEHPSVVLPPTSRRLLCETPGASIGPDFQRRNDVFETSELNSTDYCSRIQLLRLPTHLTHQFTHHLLCVQIVPSCSVFVFITNTTAFSRDPRCKLTSSISTQNFSLPSLLSLVLCVHPNALIIHVHI